ncbi:heavy metal-associated isoprenylated plant protein 32-like [Oryza glaberrima]|uniref:HMA domain-containing protein n=1 Tax=Oryza glaberrima TaxID=4538 RepID=I1QGI3_ORYGL|nr:heavy metal-associated isoprenylated plant protein 32-like [Oryza glaberrima]
MAKEQDQLIKRVGLKVSVNCCDGCRSKVLKALNLKGVLRTEVHPTAGRVAVVGDVDAGRLVKRLAKVGKIAEVIVVAQPSPEVEKRRRHDGGGGKKEASPDNGKMGGGTAPKHGDGGADDKRGENGGGGSGASSARIHGGGDDDVKAAMCCYHRAEPPAMAVPVLQPPYYGFGGCYHGTPPPAMAPCRRGRIPVVRPQPTRFADECCMYGDDDTAGCHVM